MLTNKYSEDNKRMAKNTIFLTIRLIFMLFIGLYTSRVLLEILGVEDYGIYNVVAGFVAMFVIFTSFFTSSCQRFLSYAMGEGDAQKLRDTFSIIQLVTIAGAILLLLITIPLSGLFIEKLLVIPGIKIETAYFVYYCSLVTLSLTVIAQPYIALVTAHEHINFYSIVSICDFSLKLLAVIALKYVTFDHDVLKLYALSLVLIAVLNRLAYGIYCRRKFEESAFHFAINIPLIKQVSHFSFWMGFGTVGGILKDQVGNVMLNMFFGVTLNAARAVASQVQTVISQIGSSLGTPIAPQITKSYASGDKDRAISLTLFLGKLQGYLSSAIAIPLILETKYVLNLWLKEPPQYSVEFVRWSLVLSVLFIISGAYGPLYLAIGQLKKLQVMAFIVNITFIPVCYLVYKLGAPAISVIYCGIFFQFIIMILSYSNLSSYINFPQKRFYIDVVLKLALISAITLFIGFLIQRFEVGPSLLRLIINTPISLLIFASLSYYVGFNKREQTELMNMIHKITAKLRRK